MEHYMMKIFSELEQGQWFSADTSVSSHNKNDCHDITEILLKVVLSIVLLTLTPEIQGLFI